MPRIIIRPPTCLLALLLILLDHSILAILPLLAAICHELGHFIMMIFCGVHVREIEITLFGAEIRSLPHDSGTWSSLAIYFAGAAANLLCVVVVLSHPTHTLEADFFAISSLTLAILNLLPIRSLDGGSMLETLLIRFLPIHGDRILSGISAVFLLLLWLMAVYILLLCGGNLSLMLFCAYLFVELYLH